MTTKLYIGCEDALKSFLLSLTTQAAIIQSRNHQSEKASPKAKTPGLGKEDEHTASTQSLSKSQTAHNTQHSKATTQILTSLSAITVPSVL